MRTGIKMGINWRQSPAWSAVAADFPFFLREIRALGVESVEYSCLVRADLTPENSLEELALVEAEAGEVIPAGLLVHLHPYPHVGPLGPAALSGEGREAALGILSRSLEACARLGERQGSPAHFVCHPAEDLSPVEGKGRRAELGRLSREYLEFAEGLASSLDGPVTIFCEQVPPPLAGFRFGEHPGEIMELVRGTGIGICWDTGHYALSSRRLALDPFPSEEFLARVGHVHLHGLGGDGRDHRPAETGDRYLEECLARLAASGYRETVTLEHPYAEAENEPLDRILATIGRAVELVGRHAESARANGARRPEGA